MKFIDIIEKIKTVFKKLIKKDKIITKSLEISFNSKKEKLLVLVKDYTSAETYENLVRLTQAQINNSVIFLPNEIVSKVIKIKKKDDNK